MDMLRPDPIDRVVLMGEAFDPITPAGILSFAALRAATGIKGLIVNHNTHSLYLLRQRPEMRPVFDRADLVTIDSMPLIYWGKLLGRPVSKAHRSTYTDWREDFWALAAKHRWRVYYLGGAPGVAAKASRRLLQRWPGAHIAVRDGYFDPADNDAVVAEINAWKPDIILVGMGMPRQELWIDQNYDRLERGVVFSIGAAFDYEAGVQPMPPAWMARAGFQWLFRVLTDPRRLFARYFIEPWALIRPAISDVVAAIRGEERAPIRA
jgi:N-acetylglucosaminyldiphosphoundecaprenol N-acetyl-beta-D-mannosaminyltransferase